MCLPIIAAGISAIGTLASGAAQSASYKAQAKFQERQATMEQQRGAYEGARLADRNERQLAQMRGQYLSSGIALTGSPLDVMQDSATEASLDEQAVRYGAQVRSDNLKFESSMSRMNAKSAMTGAVIGALGSVVGGLSQQADQKSQRTMISNPYMMFGAA